MKNVLLVYDTISEATFDISKVICEEFLKKELKIDSKHVANVDNLSSYDAVIIGSPIHFGKCTSRIKKFVKKNSGRLSSMPSAFYFSCLSLWELADKSLPDILLYADPSFDMKPRQRSEITFFQYRHTRWHYLKEILKLISPVVPVSIAFFKGRLILSRLTFGKRVMFLVALRLTDEIQEGDFFNPDAVRAWTEKLSLSLIV